MKTTIIKVLALVAITTFTFFSCVEDGEFETPNIVIIEPNLSGTTETTFRAVVAAYQQAQGDGDNHVTFDQDLYITGYVISSDRAQNFFEELIIQNKVDGSTSAEDPRLGFRISVNVAALSNTYQVGRKIYVNLNGLSFGESNGVYVIGKGSELDQIQAYEYRDFIVRSSEVAEITPKITTIDELTEADENTLIQLDDMQFERNQLGLTYSGEPSDEFDGFRTLESCNSSATIPLQTSTFADFTSIVVNQNRGSIQGVYSRDFRDDFSVLIINTPADISFDDTERCDPVVLNCTEPINGASNTTIFSENFEGFNGYAAEGWTNVNVSNGTTEWIIGSFNNTYAQVNGFNTGENEINVWLVTPAINLDNTTEEILDFDVQTNFNNANILTVWVSRDFTGNPATATWEQLETTIPQGNPSGFGSFEPASTVNLSCLSGNVHIGFFYQGSDPSATTRYHVDNIEISGKSLVARNK